MNSTLVLYALAVILLTGIRLFMARSQKPFFRQEVAAHNQWSLWQLFLASFLTLFAELAFIRWIAVEVRVFAYFKNLALLLCFVGFGLGCALSRRTVRWLIAIESLLGLFSSSVFRFLTEIFWKASPKVLEGVQMPTLGDGSDLELAPISHWRLCSRHSLLAYVWVFIPLGQTVSQQMDRAPSPLSAYSWNLFGSLIGILAFLAVGRMMLPPWLWLGAVLVGFSLLQIGSRDRVLTLVLVIPAVLLLWNPATPDHYSFWTPYQQIEYFRYYMPDKEFGKGEIRVNHTGYQTVINLSSDFLARHQDLVKEPLDENPYNLPFRFAKSSPHVLIVGSGAGNDVAGAVRHNSTVDAVEIDPAIRALGEREHPEHPYDSPQVTTYLTDARAFLKRTSKNYDLILFGLLDSHTQFSDYSNMRLDNFVYTEESFAEAKAHLKPDGVIFIKFQVDRPWMSRRLADMLQHTFGKPPVIFIALSSYSVSALALSFLRPPKSSRRLQRGPAAGQLDSTQSKLRYSRTRS